MILEYLGASVALPTGTGSRPPREGNLPTATTRELKGKLTFFLAAAALQEASSTPTIGSAEMKQAESTVDQLSDCPLEGIPAHRDHTTVVLVLTRNSHAQIKMGLPPLASFRNPLIIEQSRESGTLGKVSVTRRQVESIINTRTSIMTPNIGTAPNSQQDVMIKSAETS